MTRRTKGWPELAIDSWMLGMDAASVMWLRSLRLMAGGPAAEREARRMITEKLTAAATLPAAIGTATAAEAIAAATLDHYGKPVRANRRRLGAAPARARRRRRR
jgi:hypothetical protein